MAMDHPAVRHLKQADPVLGAVIDAVGVLPPGPRTEEGHLAHIARAIVYQQLSGHAAGTIHRRFEALYGGRAPTPEELLATPDEQLRAVGLSRAKVIYLRDLAARSAAGTLPVDRLHELEDEPLIETLTTVKGIGRWTAHMFLMFRLGRPNVLPDLDLGVRKAIQRVYKLRKMPTPEQVRTLGSSWSPYASFAAWYLWRSLELPGSKEAGARERSRERRARRSDGGETKTRAAKRSVTPAPRRRSATARAANSKNRGKAGSGRPVMRPTGRGPAPRGRGGGRKGRR